MVGDQVAESMRNIAFTHPTRTCAALGSTPWMRLSFLPTLRSHFYPPFARDFNCRLGSGSAVDRCRPGRRMLRAGSLREPVVRSVVSNPRQDLVQIRQRGVRAHLNHSSSTLLLEPGAREAAVLLCIPECDTEHLAVFMIE